MQACNYEIMNACYARLCSSSKKPGGTVSQSFLATTGANPNLGAYVLLEAVVLMIILWLVHISPCLYIRALNPCHPEGPMEIVGTCLTPASANSLVLSLEALAAPKVP